MEIKKSPKVDLQNRKGLFLELVNEYDFNKSDPLFPKIAINPFQLNIFERIVKPQPISVCTANQIFNGACAASPSTPITKQFDNDDTWKLLPIPVIGLP